MKIIITESQYNRILSTTQEMMGINESIPISVRRRISELPKFITSEYTWLNPIAFESFEKFFDRVVFGVVRDFTSEYSSSHNLDELIKIREDIESFVRQFIMDEYYDEIKDYYIKGVN